MPSAIGAAGDWILGASERSARLAGRCCRSSAALSVAIALDIGGKFHHCEQPSKGASPSGTPSGAFSRHRNARSTLATPSPAEERLMKLWSRAAMLAALLLTASCRVAEPDNGAQPAGNETAAAIAPILASADAKDIHSYARPLE